MKNVRPIFAKLYVVISSENNFEPIVRTGIKSSYESAIKIATKQMKVTISQKDLLKFFKGKDESVHIIAEDLKKNKTIAIYKSFLRNRELSEHLFQNSINENLSISWNDNIKLKNNTERIKLFQKKIESGFAITENPKSIDEEIQIAQDNYEMSQRLRKLRLKLLNEQKKKKVN